MLLILIVGCELLEELDIPPQQIVISEKICTLVGCFSSVGVHFDRVLDEEYIVTIEDNESGERQAAHCMPADPDLTLTPTNRNEAYPLDTPEVAEWRTVTPIIDQCLNEKLSAASK